MGELLVKIVYFGISRVAPAPGSTPLTVPGTVLGTPRYMAPEQAACDPDVDHRADLYAVGLILYHALSGMKPFSDISHGALLVAVLRGGPSPLRQISPGFPDEVYAVVEQASMRDREERYQNATALRRSIQRVLEVLPPAPERPRLTSDDDDVPTAIESGVNMTMAAAQPISARSTDSATISEIPSGRFTPSSLDAISDLVSRPGSEPDDRNEVLPDTRGSNQFQTYANTPSADLRASLEHLNDKNQRRSGPWPQYADSGSVDIDALENAYNTQSSLPAPPTLVLGGKRSPSGSYSSPSVMPPPEVQAKPSQAPAKQHEKHEKHEKHKKPRRWLLWIVSLIIGAIVVIGGLLVGLYVYRQYESYRDRQQGQMLTPEDLAPRALVERSGRYRRGEFEDRANLGDKLHQPEGLLDKAG